MNGRALPSFLHLAAVGSALFQASPAVAPSFCAEERRVSACADTTPPREAMEDPDRGDLWRVHDWRESLLHHPPHNDDEGLVARLYLTISDLYKGVLPLLSRRPELPAAAYRKIERGYSSLVLWSHSYGASSGKVDLSLQHSQDLRQITLRLLVNICTAILDRKFSFNTQQQLLSASKKGQGLSLARAWTRTPHWGTSRNMLEAPSPKPSPSCPRPNTVPAHSLQKQNAPRP